MRKFLVIGLTCCALLITGCGRNKEAKKTVKEPSISVTSTSETSKITKNSSTNSSLVKKSSSEAPNQTFWTSAKDKELQKFMQAWGTVMEQDYERNDENKNTSYAGLEFPADLKKRTLAVNDQAVSASWSPDGSGNSQYNVVAVYSTGPQYFNGHIYLFSIHNQQPVVLHTSQNQGMDDNMIHFDVTDNQVLKNGFTQIVTTGTAPAIEQNQDVLSGYSAEQILAAKVWLTKFGSVDSSVISLAVEYCSAGSEMAPVAGSVTFPRDVMIASALPMAGGRVTYANNNDGTVTIYDVPSHFQDPQFQNEEYGRQFTQNIIDTAYSMTLKEFSNQQLKTFLTKLE